MAINWSREISFAGLTKPKSAGKAVYPNKTYINLMVRREAGGNTRRNVLLIVLGVLLVIAFLKFGVFDLFDRVNQKQAELTAQTQVLESYKSQLTNYNSIKAEYETYETSKIASGDYLSVVETLDIIDRYVAPVADVRVITIEGDTVTLELGNISLDTTGRLVSELKSVNEVVDVTMSTAGNGTSKNEEQTASMVIKLQKA